MVWSDILRDSWKSISHFFISAFLGLVVFSLMQTMCLRASSVGLLKMDERSIYRFSMFVGCVFALSAHLLEDYLLGWF
jgi:hypothetical protein